MSDYFCRKKLKVIKDFFHSSNLNSRIVFVIDDNGTKVMKWYFDDGWLVYDFDQIYQYVMACIVNNYSISSGYLRTEGW
jgi:hypothetical protein